MVILVYPVKIKYDRYTFLCKIVVITSGGKCRDLAIENKIDHIIIPGGKSPRACIAYSIVQILFILLNQKIISKKFIGRLTKSIQLFNKEERPSVQIIDLYKDDIAAGTEVKVSLKIM